jgi:hypothetical protein
MATGFLYTKSSARTFSISATLGIGSAALPALFLILNPCTARHIAISRLTSWSFAHLGNSLAQQTQIAALEARAPMASLGSLIRYAVAAVCDRHWNRNRQGDAFLRIRAGQKARIGPNESFCLSGSLLRRRKSNERSLSSSDHSSGVSGGA